MIQKMRILFIFIILLASCQPKAKKQDKIIQKDSLQTIVHKPKEPYFPFLEAYFKSQNFTLEINKSERVNLKNPFTKSEEEFKKFCDTIKYQNFPVSERANLIEKYSLKKDTDIVSRIGKDLKFKLKNGKTKTLSNNEAMGESFTKYAYREHLKEIGFFVCFVSLYEGAHYLLINDVNGDEFSINGIPKISLDKTKILTTPYDAGFYFNDLSLCVWKIKNQKIEIDFIYDIGRWAFWNAEWEDDFTVRFELLPENQTELNCFDTNGDLSVDCKKIYELIFKQK